MADGGDQIQFHTADPVTGTTGVFVGSSSTGVKDEESEPLGQKIDLTNPGTSYPATYGEVHGMGKDPEWQCAASKLRGSDFRSMPIHCQKKAALNAKWSTDYFGKSDKEENPQNLSLPTSKDFYELLSSADRGITYAANAIRSEALASTAKDDGDSDKPDPCPWDTDGKKDCAATVSYTEEPIDVSDTGWTPASEAESISDDACNLMANVLGQLIDIGIKDLGGSSAIKTHEQLNGLMNSLDAAFTPFYTGWNGTIETATTNGGTVVGPSTGGWEQPPPFGGPRGFKEQYIDSVKPEEGQTHHFAAYFSAGINGAWLKATGHKYRTDYFNFDSRYLGSKDNPNDRALGDVAYKFGSSLTTRTHIETRLNPRNPKAPTAITVHERVSDRLARFTSLASSVRTTLCN